MTQTDLRHAVLRPLPFRVPSPSVSIPLSFELSESPPPQSTLTVSKILYANAMPGEIVQDLDAEPWRLVYAIAVVKLREGEAYGFEAVGDCSIGWRKAGNCAVLVEKKRRSRKCRGVMQRGNFHTDGVQRGAVAGGSCEAGSSVEHASGVLFPLWPSP